MATLLLASPHRKAAPRCLDAAQPFAFRFQPSVAGFSTTPALPILKRGMTRVLSVRACPLSRDRHIEIQDQFVGRCLDVADVLFEPLVVAVFVLTVF